MTGQPTPVGAVLRIPVDLIDPGPNARGAVGDVTELAASLRHLGQQLPVVVEPASGGRWRLIDGHRRHAAARPGRARPGHGPAFTPGIRRDGLPACPLCRATGRRPSGGVRRDVAPVIPIRSA